MFAIEVQSSFHAAHALRLPDGSLEPSHSHPFNITARLTASNLDAMDTVIDFHIIEQHLQSITAPWQNRDLNQLEPFKSTINPSAERIAEHIAQRLLQLLPPTVQLKEIRLTE